MSYNSSRTASNSVEISDKRLGREVALGGRGGAADDDVEEECRSMRELSSSAREDSKGSFPPFSASLVRRSLREQMYPEGVTTASVRGVKPVRAQVKVWVAMVWLDLRIFIFNNF